MGFIELIPYIPLVLLPLLAIPLIIRTNKVFKLQILLIIPSLLLIMLIGYIYPYETEENISDDGIVNIKADINFNKRYQAEIIRIAVLTIIDIIFTIKILKKHYTGDRKSLIISIVFITILTLDRYIIMRLNTLA